MKKIKACAFLAVSLLLLLTAVIPAKKVDAKTKCWYGKYWEYAKTGKKAVKINGSRVILRKKKKKRASWDAVDVKTKKIKKTFKLTKKTKYYIEDTNAEKNPIKKVSKKKFMKELYSDLAYCAFKVKKGKIIKAIVSLN